MPILCVFIVEKFFCILFDSSNLFVIQQFLVALYLSIQKIKISEIIENNKMKKYLNLPTVLTMYLIKKN